MQSKALRGKISIENRKFPRRQIQLPVLYAPLQPGSLPQVKKTYIDDFGAGGVAMVSDLPLHPHTLITLNLYLPPLSHDPNSEVMYNLNQCEPVTLLARVAWSKKVHDYRGYLNGLAFYDIDLENAKRLKHFLVDYELDQIVLSEE